MCNECCKEFCGWCRAFTRTERALAVLEVVLLVTCVAGLALFILHMVVCSDPHTYTVPPVYIPVPIVATTHRAGADLPVRETLDPKIECTWVPAQKTDARTHYYGTKAESGTSTTPVALKTEDPEKEEEEEEEAASDSDTDGEEVREDWKSTVLALVKMRPPNDITFGCILTIVSEFWTVTAASCIEAIEELDSLDSFIMMEEYGGAPAGRVHAVRELRVHPTRAHDVAALRSADSLARAPYRPARLLAPLDYALLTIGERFHLLGYGGFRSIEAGATGRRLRAAHVYALPARSCPAEGEGEGSALRHLWGGRGEAARAPGAGALCAGAAGARGLPCNYCGGAPLVGARGALVGVMRDNPACGVSCEPQLYTPLPLILDWLDDLIRH